MSNQKNIVKLIKAISGQANILTIPRVYLSFCASHRTALLLSQCVYWSDRSTLGEGWFYKSFKDWKKEVGLNQHATETAVKTLKDKGLLEVKTEMANGANVTHYRVNMDKLVEAVLAETDKTVLADSANRVLAENYKTSIAETTNIDCADAQPISVTLNEWFGTKPENPIVKGNGQALTVGIEQNEKLTNALETLTGRKIDQRNKTAVGFIQDLRQWGANPPKCAHFSHYWTITEGWRGEHSKPTLKEVWERWDTAQQWQPKTKLVPAKIYQ